MEDLNKPQEEVAEENSTSSDANVKFICPTCGEKERDEVLFLCNTCEREDLIEKEGILMCPSCLEPGNNFECATCTSTEVEMKAA